MMHPHAMHRCAAKALSDYTLNGPKPLPSLPPVGVAIVEARLGLLWGTMFMLGYRIRFLQCYPNSVWCECAFENVSAHMRTRVHNVAHMLSILSQLLSSPPVTP